LQWQDLLRAHQVLKTENVIRKLTNNWYLQAVSASIMINVTAYLDRVPWI
jgi:hypothetical protein